MLTGFSVLHPQRSLRNAYLFLVSLFFYWKTSGLFFILLIFSTGSNFYCGIGINRAQKGNLKLFLLIIAIITNLILLSYFKYAYFITDTVNNLFGTNFEVFNFLAYWANKTTGSHFNISVIGLPVGISFFSFQAMSYVIDLYRKKVEPVKNILDFGFYLSFFPQLVAGPIVRASAFIPQLYKRYNLSKEEFGYAVFIILNGLTKKIFIGDYLAVNIIDRVFASPGSFTGFENLMALYGYSLQVYCDFSGYTDIATGTALLMGFRLPRNFNSPYKADNLGNFWKRWHISLSSWLKDYLYIPIGGNRKGVVRTNINLMVTMLLGGLWHGANWQFVIWGGLNGVGLLFYKFWKKISPYEKSRHVIARFWKIFITFQFITFTRIWFRADSMEHAGELISQVTGNFGFPAVYNVISGYREVFAVMFMGYLIHWLPSGLKAKYRDWFIRIPLYAKIIVSAVIIFIIYQAWSAELQPFIYFQF